MIGWGAKLLTFMPGIGVLFGPLGVVFQAIGAFIKTVFEGAVKIVSNPVTLVTSISLALVCLAYGIKLGFDLDGRRAAAAVAACNIRVEQIETKINRDVAIAVEEALRAEDSVPPLPDDITEACKRSASCRSRGAL